MRAHGGGAHCRGFVQVCLFFLVPHLPRFALRTCAYRATFTLLFSTRIQIPPRDKKASIHFGPAGAVRFGASRTQVSGSPSRARTWQQTFGAIA